MEKERGKAKVKIAKAKAKAKTARGKVKTAHARKSAASSEREDAASGANVFSRILGNLTFTMCPYASGLGDVIIAGLAARTDEHMLRWQPTKLSGKMKLNLQHGHVAGTFGFQAARRFVLGIR